MNTTIEKYGSRNWAVRIDGELLAVTVYRKGARAIVDYIRQITRVVQEPQESAPPKVAA